MLFPCPSEITSTEAPVSRAPVRHATDIAPLGRFSISVCTERAGVGKTTALQEIEEALPPHSIMVTYDCYGGGRYLDPSALRHRSRDAFVQLTNELAVRLRLPLLLNLSPRIGPPAPVREPVEARLRMRWLLSIRGHMIVVAIDAADNAVACCARKRAPAEPSFVHDFVRVDPAAREHPLRGWQHEVRATGDAATADVHIVNIEVERFSRHGDKRERRSGVGCCT